MILTNPISHLSDEDKQKVDDLQADIYNLQTKTRSIEDTYRLAELNDQMEKIIEGR